MRSSQAAFDLIVAEEVTSKAVYSKKYRKPEWPGASSGATVGIGYDLGQTPRATIQADWAGRVPPAMLKALLAAQGITGEAAKPVAQRMRAVVDIPWETAIAVHEECVIPRWEARLAKALPNTDQLSPDCFGVLLSLIFNRGTSFNMTGDRYREMRAIKAHMASGEFYNIPAELRSMKRLWPTLAGLRRRRDAEAALFEKGLKGGAPTAKAGRPPRTDDTMPQGFMDADSGSPDEHSLPPAPAATVAAEVVQRRLEAMGYFPGTVGTAPGGMTAGAIAAFKLDRGLGNDGTIDDALLAELGKAEAEGFKRPIAAARAQATEATIAPKVEAVRQNWFSRMGAKVLAIPSVIGAAISGAWESLPEAKGYIEPLKDFVTDMPGWVWFAAAAVVGLFLWHSTRKTGAAVLKDFQEGRRL